MITPPDRKYKPSELPCVQEAEKGNAEWWFAWPGSRNNKRAKALCLDCPLYWQCQEVGLEDGVPYGVWGGLDEADRAKVWTAHGGKPDKFEKLIDSVINPGLQLRRDEERAS